MMQQGLAASHDDLLKEFRCSEHGAVHTLREPLLTPRYFYLKANVE
jgi:hypothetical protein